MFAPTLRTLSLSLSLALAACAETYDDPTPLETQSASLLVEGSVSPTLNPQVELAGVVALAPVELTVVGASVTPVESLEVEMPRLAEVAALDREVEFGAVGMMVKEVDGRIVVDGLIEGMPAEDAGLLVGMQVLAVDGLETESMNLEQFVAFVRGDEGTEVTLTVVSDELDEHDIVITRETLAVTETRCERVRRARQQTEFGGIGLQMAGGCGGAHVSGVVADMPADLAGLQQGEIITAVDGMSVSGASLMDVVAAIRGDVGTTVTLDMRDAGGAVRTVELERVHMVVPDGGGCGE